MTATNLVTTPPETDLATSGIAGLDDVLGGGFTRSRLYLIEGVPGSGKTTLGMQFLMEGARRGERVLYVTLSETAEELRSSAESHGWDLTGVSIQELIPSDDTLDPEQHYTMFHPSEVELVDTTQAILEHFEQVNPQRLVIDSLSEFRLLSSSPLHFRRQVLALKRFYASRKCTVLMVDDLADKDGDLQLQSLANGVVSMEALRCDYGNERRRLRIVKYRGMKFRGGFHDYNIERGGIKVFPRLIAAEHRELSARGVIKSGIGELDALLGGGIECGTSTLIQGAAGAGKSSIASQFVAAAAETGMRGAMFLFDEIIETLLTRADGLSIPLRQLVANGQITLTQVDPAELSPGEFAGMLRNAVDGGTGIIVIDSLNGYLSAMPEENFLVTQLHELLTYLNQRGVATLLVSAQSGLLGSAMTGPIDTSYLADTVILLRYFEWRGSVRQALSIVKKRSGAHERSIRELRMRDGRITVGQPLYRFRGVLSGSPTLEDSVGEVNPDLP